MNKWIRADKFLPQIGQKVLFWNPVNEIHLGYYHRDGFQVWFNGQCEIIKTVTYWQPEPKPPYLKEGHKPSLHDAYLALHDNQDNIIQSMTIRQEDWDFTTPTDETEQVAEKVIKIKNYLYLFELIFNEIKGDLFMISEEHLDDNGQELAKGLAGEFQKLQDIIEGGISPTNEWEHSTPFTTLCLLANDKSQHLVIPAMRKMYDDLSKDDTHLTASEKETEFKGWIQAMRKQYGLTEYFK